jgi:predicted DNA-binding protein
MSTLTLRMPDSKYERLKNYAKSRQVSLNKLFDELATIALTQYDAKTRFDYFAQKGSKQRGLELFDKIEKNL